MRLRVLTVVVALGLLGAPAAQAKMPKRWQPWVRIGRCEQPGSGTWGIYWRHPGPTYGGGLGVFQGTWNAV